MTRRIDTLRSLRRQRNYAQKQLDDGLARHKLTVKEMRRLAALDEDVEGGVYRGLNDRVASLERDVELYGEEWAKDDWPHAIHARALAVGVLIDGCQPE